MATSKQVPSKATAETIPLLACVALLEDLRHEGLRRGQVGTVVELLGPGLYEVEFSDNDGRAYAILALSSEQLMVLHYQAETKKKAQGAD